MRAVASRDKLRGLPAYNDRPRRFSHLEVRRLSEPGASTLDDRITATWTRLVGEGSAECPVCSGPVRAAQPCTGCGSEIS